ncbi:MAG: menaquinone biosynthesis decarboxylase [Bacteroidota bacterium]
MAYSNLSEFITALDKAGELIRISEYVSPHLEIAEITDRISKAGGKALLFENTGTDFPVLINAMGSERRMCMALGVHDLDDTGREIDSLLKKISSPMQSFQDKLKMLPLLKSFSSWMPKTIKGKGACQEVIDMQPDLGRLPVLFCWPYDGGPFITLPLVHTKDPVNGVRNTGMYRMQIFGPDTTGMHWHLHKNSARHYNEYKKLGKRMPVSVTLGGDPACTYAATAPLPDNLDEFMLAGFLRKKKVELVKCITNDIEVPADADFVIEGFVDPMEALVTEGPFGDHTGFYSLPDLYPVFHVSCITHRKKAVYPATIVGTPPQEDAWIGKATERIFLTPLRMTMVPEILDMNMPPEGVFHNITIVKIKKTYPGQAFKVMNSLWGAGQMMFNKIMIVTDEHTDIHNYDAVLDAVRKNTNTACDIFLSKGPADVLDHSSVRYASSGKMGIDATAKLEDEMVQSVKEDKIITFDGKSFIQQYPWITAVNSRFVASGNSILIVGIKKEQAGLIREFATNTAISSLIEGIRFIVFVDESVNIDATGIVAWYAANNMDPQRDIYEMKNKSGTCILIDGTRKTGAFDNFGRSWPNVIVMDDATIKAIDEKWDGLGLGTFITSPSHEYATLLYGSGAFAEHQK